MTNYINSANCPRFNQMNPAFISLINACFDLVGRIPPFVITSSFRTPKDQERLKREGYSPHPDSYHLTGQAVDIVFERLLNPWHFSKCDTMDSIYYPLDNYWHFEPKRGRVSIPIGLSEFSNYPIMLLFVGIFVLFLLLQ